MSVVIGTLNRGSLLVGAIHSLLNQRLSAAALEIIVVDNGSTDDTARLVQDLTQSSPDLHYVLEPRLGLSYARNRGIAHATGDVVAFLDDDAEADPDWAERLARVFRQDQTVAAVGGKTLVRWPGERPSWVTARIEPYYGKCDYGDTPRRLAFPEYPYGSNMAIRRGWLQELEGFRTDLGARGDNLMAGEETELFERLNTHAAAIAYEPSAIVHHWAAPERLTRRWCLRRAFRHGLSTAIMAFARGSHRPGVSFTYVVRATGRASIGAVATLMAIVSAAHPSTVMSRATHTAYWGGFCRGAFARLARLGG